MRQETDPADLARHASRAVGEATAVDRCLVAVVEDGVLSVRGDWQAPGVDLPAVPPSGALPAALAGLLTEDGDGFGLPVEVDDVDADARLTAADANAVRRALGVRALGLVPLRAGRQHVGWLVVASEQPRSWSERVLTVCRGVAADLGTNLVQVQLYDQQRESVQRLQEIDLVRHAFVSNVSHELRTPLTSISGYVELVAEGALGPLDGPLERAIGVIARNTERLRSLVEDLLLLSAHDATSIRLDTSPLDLTPVVVDCVRTMQAATPSGDLVVDVEVPDVLPAVLGDREQLDRVVSHLVGNALKFTPDGGRVRVRLEGDHAAVRLQVSDTGIGIPVEEQHRLFERFFRSTLSQQAEIQGAGLGLALAHTIVGLHGGTLEVSSARGTGTTVTVELPVAAAS
nr:GAF domain-containing sensor histidine kinase [Nocardioides luti]